MALDFPNNPSHGQVYAGFTYDSTVPGWRDTPEVASGMPAGSIMAWGTETPPANWLICDGSAVSRTTYASLFAAIGLTYGVGDGATTFNLPDLRGRVPVGKDVAQSEFNFLAETGGSKTTAKYGDGTTTGYGLQYTSSLGSGDATGSNLPPYQVVHYIIKFSAGVSATDSELATRLAAVENKFNTGQNDVPAGSITQFAGTTIPTNWLLCDGSAVARATWPSLYAAIGTTYGAGDGSTTFNLPDIPNGDAAGIISTLRINSQVTVTTTLTDLSGVTSTVPFKAGRTYRITFSSPNLNASATGRSRFDVMVNGVVVSRDYIGITAGNGGIGFNIQTLYTASADGSYVVKVAGMVDAGSATTMTVYGDLASTTLLNVEDLGESAASALRTKSIIKATAGVSTNDSTFVTRIGAVETVNDTQNTRLTSLETATTTTNRAGLVPVIPTSVTVGSGSGTISSNGTITFTGTSTLLINGVFTAAYTNYRIVILVNGTSLNYDLASRFSTGGTAATAAVYFNAGERRNQAGTASSYGAGGFSTQWFIGGGETGYNNGKLRASIDVYSPFLSTNNPTMAISNAFGTNPDSSGFNIYNTGTSHDESSRDGIQFYPTSGNMSGVVRIYGYRE